MNVLYILPVVSNELHLCVLDLFEKNHFKLSNIFCMGEMHCNIK